MNCFHFSVSLRYNTTFCGFLNRNKKLWIAFIFQYLWDTTQPFLSFYFHFLSCELLSFFSIFEIQHNLHHRDHLRYFVVNCFHFSVSLRYNTTTVTWNSIDNQLWIAFIFQYLWDTTQRYAPIVHQIECCELLSFFSIFEIQHNINPRNSKSKLVVNCFHFSVSLRYNTTFLILS